MPVDSRKRDYTLTVIRALILSQKGGCTLTQLNADYYEQEGEAIPWKALGYVSLLNFLQSVPKAIQIENRGGSLIVKGVASDKSKHISTLIANQKSQTKKHVIGRKTFRPSHYYPKTAPPRVHIPAEVLTNIIGMIENHPDGVNKDYILSVIQSRMPYSYVSVQDMEEQLHELSHKIYLKDNKMFPARSKAENLVHHSQQKESPYGGSTDKEKWGQVVMTASGNEDYDDTLDYDNEDDYFFTPTAYIQHPVPMNKKSSKPKSASNFIEETVTKCQGQIAENHAVNNTPKAQDYNTWNDEYNFTENDGAHIVEEQQSYRNRENLDILINDRIKFRLQQLILKYPDGIWCADLPDKYLEEYKVPLNYTELGFNSVREFSSCLPNIFHSVQPHSTGDFKLYNAKKEIPTNTKREHQKTSALIDLHSICMNEDEVEALPPTISIESSRVMIPDDVMNMGESVGYLSVEDMANEDKQYVEVFVVEVFTPSFFWIQLRKKRNTFEKLMDDLHNFYSTESAKYIIPPVILEKGLNCACLYNGVWHRGIIKTVRPDLQVTVMFYDYGTLKTYSSEAIHYLHRAFSFLPAQAIPCGLVNTRPYNERVWTHNATYKFAVRTTQIPLVATIASYNTENNSMMITLTDTLEDEDVHINDWLVEQKLAKHGKVVCMKNRNFPFRYYLECKARAKRNCKLSNCSVKDKPVVVNKVASYESNIRVGYTRKADSALNEGIVKKLRSVISRSHSKIDSTSQMKGSNAVTCIPKEQRELQYEKLLRLKRKIAVTESSDLTNEGQTPNNIKNNDINFTSSVSSPVLNKINISRMIPSNVLQEDEQQLTKTCPVLHDSDPRNINDTNNSGIPVRMTNFKNVPEPSTGAPEEVSSIPLNILNMQFRIREPDEEDEQDIRCFGKCPVGCDGQHDMPSIDWSAIRENISHSAQSVPVSKDLNIKRSNTVSKDLNIIEQIRESTVKECKPLPPPETCFLRAVRNSAHFAECDKDIRWSPAANIVKIEDPSELLLRQTRFSRNGSKTIKVAITSDILDMLSGKTLSRGSELSLGHVCQDRDEIPSSKVLKGTSCTNDNSSDTNSKDMSDIKSSQTHVQDSLSPPNNYYTCIKVLPPTMKLLKVLAKQKHTSNNISNLDSDDLSDSQCSVTDSAIIKESVVDNNTSIDIDEGIYVKECNMSIDESNPSTGASVSHEFHLDASSEDCNLNSDDSVANALNVETMSNECTPNDHNRALLETASEELGSEALTNGLLSAKEVDLPIVQTTPTHSVKNDELNNDAPMEEGMSVSELVPYNTDESIPVFNDLDIESDTDEWDAYASYSDVVELADKMNSRYTGNVQRLDESNNSLRIEEVDEGEIGEKKSIDNWGTKENKICESAELKKYNVDDLKCDFASAPNQCYKSIKTEPPVTYCGKIEGTEKQNSALTDPVDGPLESYGKKNSLLKMLNKVKS